MKHVFDALYSWKEMCISLPFFCLQNLWRVCLPFLVMTVGLNYLGCEYKGLVFCRNNGWIMENMDKGLTVPKRGLINPEAFGIFLAKLSAPTLVQWVPCPCFPLFNHYFYIKLSLFIHIHIPNIYLGLGFEFGLQRIRDLAFMCL